MSRQKQVAYLSRELAKTIVERRKWETTCSKLIKRVARLEDALQDVWASVIMAQGIGQPPLDPERVARICQEALEKSKLRESEVQDGSAKPSDV